MTTVLTHALRILVVEDDPGVREVLTLMLASLGHITLEAASPREALARLGAGEAVDLVLTDLNMPGMSGWELARAIKARRPRLRVALITGALETRSARSEPVDRVIRKPVTFDTLREAISGYPTEAADQPVEQRMTLARSSAWEATLKNALRPAV